MESKQHESGTRHDSVKVKMFGVVVEKLIVFFRIIIIMMKHENMCSRICVQYMHLFILNITSTGTIRYHLYGNNSHRGLYGGHRR